MDCYAYQKNNAAVAAEELRISEELESLVCPKPRRFAGGWSHSVAADHIRPINRTQMGILGHNMEAGLLDIILAEGSYGNDKSAGQVVSSPPYFFGSPPTRSLNPVTQDDRFGNQKVVMPLLSSVKSSSPSSCKAGGTRMKMGQKPAAVRIEGFDCLGRDRQNCSIYTIV